MANATTAFGGGKTTGGVYNSNPNSTVSQQRKQEQNLLNDYYNQAKNNYTNQSYVSSYKPATSNSLVDLANKAKSYLTGAGVGSATDNLIKTVSNNYEANNAKTGSGNGLLNTFGNAITNQVAQTKERLENANNYSGYSSGGGNQVPSATASDVPYSQSSSSSSGTGKSAEQERDDLITMMRNLLDEQLKKSGEAYKAQLEEQYAKNKSLHRDNADQINLNKLRAERYSNNLYGNESGAGARNNTAINLGWMKSHNENNRNLATNDATALSNYNSNMANAYNTLASAYGNAILPIWTNDIQNQRELAYREKANQMDYDYRKFLINAGIV